MKKNIHIFQAVFIFFTAILMALQPVVAATCSLLPVKTWYNTIIAGAYRLEFEYHDPPGPHSYRWTTDTAMRILHPDGSFCTASDDLPIVILPVYVAAKHYIYLTTYSADDNYLFVIDARNCATIWQSPDWFNAGFRRTTTGFYIPDVGWLKIGPDCLPETISGKPVSGLKKPH